MKKDIILAGVGGQGILSIAAIIGYASVEAGLNVKQSEVHGMSQRGGDVYSHFRLSDKEIASDLIPFGKADMIISVEPMESLRYLPMLAMDGTESNGIESAARNAFHEATDEWASAEYRADVAARLAKRCLESIQQ